MTDVLLFAGSAAAGGAAGFGSWVAAPALDRLNARQLDRLRPQVEAVGADAGRLPEFLRAWRAATAVTAAVFWFGLGMPPVAVFLVFFVNQAGPLLVEYWAACRRKKLTEQVAVAARGLAARARVGVTLGEALAGVARETPDPLGGVLRRVTARLEQGQDVREVLAELKRQVRVDAVALLAAALLVTAEQGGRLADVLARISQSLDELHRVTRKRDVDTAAGRFMVLVMAVFPVGFAGMLGLMDGGMSGALFDTLGGQVVLAVVGFLVYASVRWASRILAKVE